MWLLERPRKFIVTLFLCINIIQVIVRLPLRFFLISHLLALHALASLVLLHAHARRARFLSSYSSLVQIVGVLFDFMPAWLGVIAAMLISVLTRARTDARTHTHTHVRARTRNHTHAHA